ncbi:11067_t:CDS:1, partial [Racocetra persica]
KQYRTQPTSLYFKKGPTAIKYLIEHYLITLALFAFPFITETQFSSPIFGSGSA